MLGTFAGAQESVSVEALVERALQNELYKDRYWWTLLHYKKTPLGTKSLIDDPTFFVSPDGKSNPESELIATVQALFQPADEERKQAVCRFIARYTWLRKRLGVDEMNVPEEVCPEFQETMDKIQPRGATLIFPTAYINSPASMFGHTLLRIETSYTSKLLSQAVNYSASTDETNGFLFAFKGIFGFYKGYFSVLPYYDKVEEYNDIDQRDIWEYPLNLTEEEVRRMLMHLWEVRSIFSYYYFFDENCSYTLLFLFEAARPSLDLTDRFGLWVIPIDTIRAIEASGLIEAAQYRPSKATRIKHLVSMLDKRNQDMALSIVNGKMEPETVLHESLSMEEQRAILDLVVEYLQYRYAKKKITKEMYLPVFLKALTARSRLGMPSGDSDNIPVPSNPVEGHLSSKMGFGFGFKDFRRDHFFQEIRYRPGHHDLLDNDEGYIEGSHIEFFSTVLRYYLYDDRVELQDCDLATVTSLSARDRFFKPISWKAGTGLTQGGPSEERESLLFYLNGGVGYSYKNPFLGLCSFMVEADINLGGKLKDRYAAGLGGSLGIVRSLGTFYKVHLYVKGLYYGFSEFHERIEMGCLQRFKITTNSNIQLEFVGKELSNDFPAEVRLICNAYF